MPKYVLLERYLSEQHDDSCSLTFSQIEGLIGTPLPASARRHQSWWGNDRTHAQARSWMRAGWTVEQPRLDEERVRFARIDTYRRAREKASGSARSQVIVRNLDSEVVAVLKRRAQRKGHSMEHELRAILTGAARPERNEMIAEADRIRAMTPGPLKDSVTLLRQDRDSR
ncbi:MAG: hypothetical protein OXI57_04245 [Rhodospirillales bacterium]|nr:hypothetical protein [Rhodospirillales bacterium]